MKLAQILEELKPSQYRQYVKGWDKNRYKEIFQRYTDDPKAFRIYLPFKGTVSKSINVPENVFEFLDALGYFTYDDSYLTGLAYKRGQSFESVETAKTYKIGRLIQDVIDRGSNEKNTQHLHIMDHYASVHGGGDVKEFARRVLKTFNNDPQRQASKDQEYFIVISRHPYDIAGMSTNRGWLSCMNLKSGSYKEYVELDVKNGTLVAYLVKNDDKNINHPVGRVLIKPFINVNDPKQVAFGVENKVYGTNAQGFQTRVAEWADEVNKSEKLEGMFEFNQDLYNDNIFPAKYIGKNGLKPGDVFLVPKQTASFTENGDVDEDGNVALQLTAMSDSDYMHVRLWNLKTDEGFGSGVIRSTKVYKNLVKILKRGASLKD